MSSSAADATAVVDAIYMRRAIRAYTGEPVDRSTIERLIDAAIQAPNKMLKIAVWPPKT